MSLPEVLKRINPVGYSAADEAEILAAITDSYLRSDDARKMFDELVSRDRVLTIEYSAGKAAAAVGGFHIWYDLSYTRDFLFIAPDGTAVPVQTREVVLHEAVHAILGMPDNWNRLFGDSAGDTVRHTNLMHRDLGVPDRVSYTGLGDNSFLETGRSYSLGLSFDHVWVAFGDRQDWSLRPYNTKDLFIGDNRDNEFRASLGDDLLVGNGGNDVLNGGLGRDTAIYFDDPLAYDIRLGRDGVWTVRHARGEQSDGRDTLIDMNVMAFENGEKFELKRKGISFQTDLALVIDTTGSMGDDIGAVKANARNLIEAAFQDADTRVGIVGFKDPKNGESNSTVLRFTDHDSFADRKSAALSALNGITVGGGGDIPEGTYSGLLRALDGTMGEWRLSAGSSKIILFTDAPPNDTHLKSLVAMYASNLGVTLTGSTTSKGEAGIHSTFEFEPTWSSYGDTTDWGDDLTDTLTPSESSDTTAVARIDVYTIFTGFAFDTATKDALREIAEENGGTHHDATTGDELSSILLDIIRAGLRIMGSAAAEELLGGRRNDDIRGEDGDDFILGFAEGDALFGGEGSDLIGGGRDRDWIEGGKGDDSIDGGSEGDWLFGQDGDDRIVGEAGDDLIEGGLGRDTIFGGAEGDVLRGGAGDDIVSGEDGYDWIQGEEGSDLLEGGNGNDLIEGGADGDLVFGGDGADLVLGGADGDVLYGDAGSDLIGGGGGWDFISGGDGDDGLDGGDGNDTIIGADGNDILVGDGGDDRLFGGAGDDRLVAGAGNDHLQGDAGADTFVITAVGGVKTIVDLGMEDRISVTSSLSTAQILARAGVTDGGSTVFSLEDGTQIVVAGRTGADADWFA